MRSIGIREPVPPHGGVIELAPGEQGALLQLVGSADDRLDQPAPLFHNGNGGVPFDAMFPMGAEDTRIRQVHAVDPGRFYALEHENQRTALATTAAPGMMGHEGTDWQNPYAWAARGVLVYPNPASTGLSPSYGVNKAADASGVALNVRATAGMLEIGNTSG